MKIEDQVASAELSKELKALGVKQDSVWFWNTYITSRPYLSVGKQFEDKIATDGTYLQYSVSAYTVAELGEMLPMFVSTSKIAGIPSIGYRCFFSLPPLSKEHYEEAKIEADARAKMLIYLIREGVIKAGNIK